MKKSRVSDSAGRNTVGTSYSPGNQIHVNSTTLAAAQATLFRSLSTCLASHSDEYEYST